MGPVTIAAMAGCQHAVHACGVAAASPYAPEAAALFARMDNPPDDDRKTLIDTFIRALKDGATSGSDILGRMDAFWVLAAADDQAASLDWTGAHDLGAMLSGGAFFRGTLVPDRGWMWNGNSGDLNQLDTGIALGTTPTQCTADAFHMGAFMADDDPANGAAIGTSSPQNFIWAAADGGSSTMRILATVTISSPVGSGPRHFVGSRAGTTETAYANGVAGTSGTATRPLVASLTLGNVGQVNPVTVPLAIAHFGLDLSAAEILDLYHACQAYLQGVGVAA
ncbi:MAG TPA: hypothetical protein VFW19_13930 [Allosphingosinicella sp.]|nr:hypothetical protein [Allosphingosinicella sp.]